MVAWSPRLATGDVTGDAAAATPPSRSPTEVFGRRPCAAGAVDGDDRRPLCLPCEAGWDPAVAGLLVVMLCSRVAVPLTSATVLRMSAIFRRLGVAVPDGIPAYLWATSLAAAGAVPDREAVDPGRLG